MLGKTSLGAPQIPGFLRPFAGEQVIDLKDMDPHVLGMMRPGNPFDRFPCCYSILHYARILSHTTLDYSFAAVRGLPHI